MVECIGGLEGVYPIISCLFCANPTGGPRPPHEMSPWPHCYAAAAAAAASRLVTLQSIVSRRHSHVSTACTVSHVTLSVTHSHCMPFLLQLSPTYFTDSIYIYIYSTKNAHF